MEYTLIENTTYTGFVASVQENLNAGWQLHGPTQATQFNNGESVIYTQAMTRGDDRTYGGVQTCPIRTQTHEVEPVEHTSDELSYAKRLVGSIFLKHYAHEEPYASGTVFQPANDLMGVLSQIDNMLTGLVRKPDPDAWTNVKIDEVLAAAKVPELPSGSDANYDYYVAKAVLAAVRDGK